MPVDCEEFAADGAELKMTVGKAKRDVSKLLRANARIIVKFTNIKAQVPDKTSREISNMIVNGYRLQIEKTGRVIMQEPTGMVKISYRKDEG